MVPRTRSKRRFGAVLSLRGNEYINCPWGVKEKEVLAESGRNGLEVDGALKREVCLLLEQGLLEESLT